MSCLAHAQRFPGSLIRPYPDNNKIGTSTLADSFGPRESFPH